MQCRHHSTIIGRFLLVSDKDGAMHWNGFSDDLEKDHNKFIEDYIDTDFFDPIQIQIPTLGTYWLIVSLTTRTEIFIMPGGFFLVDGFLGESVPIDEEPITILNVEFLDGKKIKSRVESSPIYIFDSAYALNPDIGEILPVHCFTQIDEKLEDFALNRVLVKLLFKGEVLEKFGVEFSYIATKVS